MKEPRWIPEDVNPAYNDCMALYRSFCRSKKVDQYLSSVIAVVPTFASCQLFSFARDELTQGPILLEALFESWSKPRRGNRGRGGFRSLPGKHAHWPLAPCTLTANVRKASRAEQAVQCTRGLSRLMVPTGRHICSTQADNPHRALVFDKTMRAATSEFCRLTSTDPVSYRDCFLASLQ